MIRKGLSQSKGLSQILYLIIAASVLMMIAMVITFTATDTIGGVGGNTKEKQCTGSISGKCTATQSGYIEMPSSCFDQNEQVIPAVDSAAGNYPGASAPSGWSSGSYGEASDGTTYVACPS